MNIYKAPNPIISPKPKVYRRGAGRGGGGGTQRWIHLHTHIHSLSTPPPHIHLSQCQEEKATGTGKDASLEQIWRLMYSWNDGVRSGESSIETRPDTRICFVSASFLSSHALWNNISVYVHLLCSSQKFHFLNKISSSFFGYGHFHLLDK